MPNMGFHAFFGWDSNVPAPPPMGPTKPSYASWQTSVIAFSLLWLLLSPGNTPIARLALAYLRLGFTAGDWDWEQDRTPMMHHEEADRCALTL